VTELGRRVSARRIDAVCGPLSGGAFLAELMAADLGVDFAFAERVVTDRIGLFAVDYWIAPALREALRGKRVAIVDDAISAGSAVRGTLADIKACGARPLVLGALIAFGSGAREIAADERIPFESLVQLPNPIWAPTECPMCALGTPLQTP
jgi:orotate phosphoribosyltransferase